MKHDSYEDVANEALRLHNLAQQLEARVESLIDRAAADFVTDAVEALAGVAELVEGIAAEVAA